MIDFRYHLVSIIAVFFALAVGIVLGAGPLGERVQQNLPAQLESMREQNSELQSQILAFEMSQEYQQEFVELVADQLVSGRLAGQSVLVIGLPGVGGNRLGNVRGMLERSGATVTGTMEVDGSWADQDSEAALDALAVELTTKELNTEANGYQRGATVLADAVLTSVRPEDVSVDPAAGVEGAPGDPSQFVVDESIVAGFTGADFIEVEGELTAKANVAVVVAEPTARAEPPAEGEDGEASEAEGEPEEWFDRMIQLIDILDDAARGVVVAGDRNTAAGHDVIGLIRSGEGVDGDVSTVDSVELKTGQVAVVYAVAERAGGGSGHYGLTESAGALSPPVPPLPEPEPPAEETPEGDDAETGEDGTGEGDGSGTDGESSDGADEGGPDEDDAVGAGATTGEGEAS